ncbi:serine/threonine protein kinase, partial [Erysipelatoclostridium ramosum]|nr:serine/threonine protein kinase [Thomasclavelia ramosa]
IYAIGAVLKTMVQKDVTAKDIHSPFQHIIETCMQLDPDKRYQSVGELQKALGYCEEKSLPHASVSVLLT